MNDATRTIDCAASSVALVASGTLEAEDSPEGAKLAAAFDANATPVGPAAFKKVARELAEKLKTFPVPASLTAESGPIAVASEFKNDSGWPLRPTELFFVLGEAVAASGRWKLVVDPAAHDLLRDQNAPRTPAAPLEVVAHLDKRSGGLRLQADLVDTKSHEILLSASHDAPDAK